MTTQSCQTQTESYKSTDLKLSSLILCSIQGSSVEVFSEGNYSKKMIEVTYPKCYQDDVNKLINDFINRRAVANISNYNRALNICRDKLKD